MVDAEEFIRRVEVEEKWGDSTRKYCIHRQTYPGYKALLETIR